MRSQTNFRCINIFAYLKSKIIKVARLPLRCDRIFVQSSYYIKTTIINWHLPIYILKPVYVKLLNSRPCSEEYHSFIYEVKLKVKKQFTGVLPVSIMLVFPAGAIKTFTSAE